MTCSGVSCLISKLEVNEAMVGLKKAEAGSDTVVAKKKQKQSDFEEEWGGITVDM